MLGNNKAILVLT